MLGRDVSLRHGALRQRGLRRCLGTLASGMLEEPRPLDFGVEEKIQTNGSGFKTQTSKRTHYSIIAHNSNIMKYSENF